MLFTNADAALFSKTGEFRVILESKMPVFDVAMGQKEFELNVVEQCLILSGLASPEEARNPIKFLQGLKESYKRILTGLLEQPVEFEEDAHSSNEGLSTSTPEVQPTRRAKRRSQVKRTTEELLTPETRRLKRKARETRTAEEHLTYIQQILELWDAINGLL